MWADMTSGLLLCVDTVEDIIINVTQNVNILVKKKILCNRCLCLLLLLLVFYFQTLWFCCVVVLVQF